jgi:hypothetical protein
LSCLCCNPDTSVVPNILSVDHMRLAVPWAVLHCGDRACWSSDVDFTSF